ncbi:MAG: efflux RND transporter permease subunit, partial [bacterium]|nr:efflux RND transporter permease subunit [bacterium]
MKKLVAFFAERSLIVNVLSVGILIAGAIFLINANREAFPRVEYNWVLAQTLYPGASPADIEKHISIAIEDQLREVDGVEEIYSSSIESMSIVAVKLDPDLDDMSKIVNDVKDAVDMVSDLPDDAEDPVVTELSTSLIPVIEASVSRVGGANNDEEERELRWYSKMLEDKLRDLSGTARIDRKGYRDREMIVEVNPNRLDQYYIGLNEVINSLSQKNLNFPGGLVKTSKEDVMIRTIGEVENAPDIRNVLVKANDQGNWVRIRDIAVVKDSFDEETETNNVNGRKSVTLTVMKKERADIIELVDDINQVVADFEKQYEGKCKIALSNDLSYFVKRRLNVLVNNAIVGLILVFLSLYITLGWRISVVTALGIPLAFCLTFIWMGQAGVTINLMSMFGLIIVLGMLVDDAIVV